MAPVALGLLAGAWWPHHIDAALAAVLPRCGRSPADEVCALLLQHRQDVHQQGLGLQWLLGLTLLWMGLGLGLELWRRCRTESHADARERPAAEPASADHGAEHATDHGTGVVTLREIGRLLGGGAVNGPALLRTLAPLQTALGAHTVAVWLDDTPRQVLGCSPLLTSQGAPSVALSALLEGATLQPGAHLRPPSAASPAFVLTAALRNGATALGTLIVEFGPGQVVNESDVQLAETFAAMASLALAAVCNSQEERRLALLEERGAIAAELHDSLAQSLAYMKIQVAQLQRGLDPALLPPELLSNARDLRAGLSNAYRDVRELIAAFRVRMGPGGLRAAVQDTLDELAQRGGLEIAFEHELERCPLGVNEEFHVLQVIREALSNTVRHAGAEHAWVDMRPAGHRLEVTIDDDGRGLREPPPQGQHYGLGIMQERARSLGGTLALMPRPGGGTRVLLRFAPQSLPTDALPQEPA